MQEKRSIKANPPEVAPPPEVTPEVTPQPTPEPAAARSGPALVVMAKPAVPGRVKTRLCPPLSHQAAAGVHAAMLKCVLARLGALAADRGFDAVLALAGEPGCPDPGASVHYPGPPAPWRVVDQGSGDLGRRIAHVWRLLDGRPAAFFGVDSPDLPDTHLRAVADLLAGPAPGVAIGPVGDGGYWTLAATSPVPPLLSGIDWGTPSVYHQSHARAAAAGVALTDLPPWHDVDDRADLVALMQRVATTNDRAVSLMATSLTRLCEGYIP